MMTSPITKRGTIKARHPVREGFAGQSTGNMGFSGHTGYYSTKGHAVNAFDFALQFYDLCLDRDDLADFYGDAGRKMIAVHDECHKVVGYAVLTWYRMPSGNYEFLAYLT